MIDHLLPRAGDAALERSELASHLHFLLETRNPRRDHD
jgi:hypothetical protein